MLSRAIVSALLLNLVLLGSQVEANAAPSTRNSDQKVEKQDLSGYFLSFDGRALPVKQAAINGQPILSAPIVSLTLPVNVSGYVKPGLNELTVDFTSDPKVAMNIVIEKRTPGPKKEELAKLSLAANQSNGAPQTQKISFNLPKDASVSAISELSEADKKAIEKQLQNYWTALSERKAEKLRALYRDSLEGERKLCPENASFFDKILNKEASVIRNQNIKLDPVDTTGLSYKVEGDKVKLYREDKKPLVSSNEVDVQIDPVMIEVQGKKGQSSAKAKTKERVVRYFLYFKQNQSGGDWDIALPPNA
jgi:hypothetical protein